MSLNYVIQLHVTNSLPTPVSQKGKRSLILTLFVNMDDSDLVAYKSRATTT